MKIVVDKPSKCTLNQDKALCDLLNETLETKGVTNKLNLDWKDEKTLVADEIPSLALHSFLLKAEEQGLGYTVERNLTITFT